MHITAYQLAERFQGLKEVEGSIRNHPLIMAMLQLDNSWPENDETPWCAAFYNFICWLLNLPRSKSLAARKALDAGRPVNLEDAKVGFDVVVLERGAGGHVGFYAGQGWDRTNGARLIHILGGNQGNGVNVASFPASRLLGIRRLYE